MNKVAFLISKPLQLLISLAIINDAKYLHPVELIIIDGFKNADKLKLRLSNSLKNDSRFSVAYAKNHTEAHNKIIENNYKTIYIDSDVGFNKYIALIKIKKKLQNFQLYVYEEGSGTYRTDLYRNPIKTILNTH